MVLVDRGRKDKEGQLENSASAFFFNTLQTIQCAYPPLNPQFSPFVDICVCLSHAFNNIKSAQSIRWQTLTGVPQVKVVPKEYKHRKFRVQPGNPRQSCSPSRGIPARERENACTSQ